MAAVIRWSRISRNNLMTRSDRKLIGALVFLPLAMTLIGYLVFRETTIKRPPQISVTTAGYVEMCFSCHAKVKLDTAHAANVVGCSPCHLGNPLAIGKKAAHKGMVLNPGDLRVVDKTCAVAGCHPTYDSRVKKSLMATNRGILATLLYYWGEADNQNGNYSVKKLMDNGRTSLALSYYRQLCATCHLWKKKNDLPGAPKFFNEKGGGCTACHDVPAKGEPRITITSFAEDNGNDSQKNRPHPLIIKKVPDENCLRCHNRSGRIGLSYIGIFESEGYGTPYKGCQPSPHRLPGNRFYLKIADDVHHKKGMSCIDCHTQNEIMGDGTNYAHYEDQLEISCVMCHSKNPGTTRKHKKVNNIEKKNGKFVLIGKINGRQYPLDLPNKTVCLYPGHKRVSCEACHSTWVPQCYGCHIKHDARETNLDKLTMKETAGWWQEGRSYIRYEKPMLAVWGNRVVIVTPGCQDVVTTIDKNGHISGGFNRFTMAAISPHTTQAKGRSCKDCHASPKAIGLGEGTVVKKNGKWRFFPVDKGFNTLKGRTVGLDNFVTIDGRPLQHGSRKDLRPFNGEELRRILRVGLCLRCHPKATDPAYRNYNAKRPCPVYKEP